MSAQSPGTFTVADATIHSLVESLNRQFLLGDLPASLVRIRADDDGLEVGFRPLGDDHPSVWLTGTKFDADVDAIGVVTGGRMFSLDDPSATLGRTAVAVIVSRRGEVASTSMTPDGEHRGGDELSGVVVDLLKRALDVPTAPAPCEPDVLYAQAWLIDIMAFTATHDRIPSWNELVRLHPAVLAHEPTADLDLTTHDVTLMLRAFSDYAKWPLLRAMLDDRRLAVPGLNSGEGAWFDDGSFARRLLVDRPLLRHVRADVRALLPHRLWQRLSTTLDGAGIPTTCWPDPESDWCASA